MGWSDEMQFRDCPWCALSHGQMRTHMAGLSSQVPGAHERYYAFLTCPACAGPIVLEITAPDEEPSIYAEIPESDESGLGERIAHLPDDVDQYYRDASKVLRAGVPDAAAVQLRRTLEAAIAHYQVSERTLVKGIEKLIAEGHVTKAFGEALHHIRKVGNAGAHASDERLDDATVRPAFEFTTALLRDLFEVPGRLREIRSAPDDDVT